MHHVREGHLDGGNSSDQGYGNVSVVRGCHQYKANTFVYGSYRDELHERSL